ncbi:Alcohol dehydrogenase superfamily, zinc-type [Niveomyces insectorum RCEF 264]|uniref:Alcohol dehydrogenase superfamily, zinc-type n=1 Tax=Niveomyces insectorum RCEF 264 TaxID=1081102 RepID=A0A167XNU3_9HYPO|nr:Alcohol dehydrogenase superfamily, zinc-type [Niveomyces insectorum RCEF 264]
MTADTVEFFAYRGSTENRVVPIKAQRQVGSRECLVEITHSGYCATDTHFVGRDMGLGHEGVGIVRRVGPLVTQHKVGDRVGWGFVHEACFNCKQCLSGGEIYCLRRKMYGFANLDQGSLGSHAVWNENFLIPVPAAMSSADAAPLMCAGATVFGSLQQRGYKSTDRVGVVGVGGLGHLAIQFAHKMGMQVVAFSHTEAKRADAKRFGADAFVVTGGIDADKGDTLTTDMLGLSGGRLDHLLVCSTVQPDWRLYLDVLEPRATIYPLTAFEADVSYPHLALIFSGVTIQGTMIATKQGYVDMLAFCTRHDIHSANELYPLTLAGIEACKTNLAAGRMRYRGVLVAEGADRTAEQAPQAAPTADVVVPVVTAAVEETDKASEENGSTTNGTSNGTSNGISNGTSNGTSNGSTAA